MGLLSGFSSKPIQNISWTHLTDDDSLEDLISKSFENTIVIYKHSTRCSISSFVLKNLENEWHSDIKAGMYFLDLINNRSMSNKIASELNVWHESPQLIVVRNGKVVAHASHHNISLNLIVKE